MISTGFADYLSKLLGEEEYFVYAQCCQKPLKKSLTINPSKISSEAFECYAREHGWTLEKHPFLKDSYSYYIDRDDTSLALGNHWMHQCGYFYIQEIAAATPAYLIDITPGMLILDIAASPGGKTNQLASKLSVISCELSDNSNNQQQPTNNYGLVIANDIDTLRIRTLEENLRRMGCWNTATSKLDGTKWGSLYPEMFDAILVDAPCSGEGTAFKSDDALAHRRIEEIKKIAGLQIQILESAIHACKVGGQIIYSTCTLNTLENEGVLAHVLQKFSGSIRLETVNVINTEQGIELQEFGKDASKKVARFWPHIQKTGGFFVSKLTKIASSTPEKNQGKISSISLKSPRSQSSPYIKSIVSYLFLQFGISIDKKLHHLRMQGDYVYLGSPLLKHLEISCVHAGICIGKYIRGVFIPFHHLATTLGSLANHFFQSISEEALQAYTEKQDISLEIPATHGEFIILQYQGKGVGIAKVIDGQLKSKFEN